MAKWKFGPHEFDVGQSAHVLVAIGRDGAIKKITPMGLDPHLENVVRLTAEKTVEETPDVKHVLVLKAEYILTTNDPPKG